MKKIKKYKNPFNGKEYVDFSLLEKDVQRNYSEDLSYVMSKGVSLKQYMFNLRSKREPFNKYGRSIISGKPTDWNEVNGRYERLLPDEREQYNKIFRERMKKVHKVEYITRNIDHQKKMLKNRKISGVYKYKNKYDIEYVGSYELDFIRHLESLGWGITDIESPSNKVIMYEHKGSPHSYIPDFYLKSLDLFIEIKASDNNHYRARDIEMEFAKDVKMQDLNLNYIKIMDKDYKEFDKIVKRGKP